MVDAASGAGHAITCRHQLQIFSVLTSVGCERAIQFNRHSAIAVGWIRFADDELIRVTVRPLHLEIVIHFKHDTLICSWCIFSNASRYRFTVFKFRDVSFRLHPQLVIISKIQTAIHPLDFDPVGYPEQALRTGNLCFRPILLAADLRVGEAVSLFRERLRGVPQAESTHNAAEDGLWGESGRHLESCKRKEEVLLKIALL